MATKHARKREALAEHFADGANELRELTERETPPKVKASTRAWWAERRRRENTDLIALEYTPPPVSCVPHGRAGRSEDHGRTGLGRDLRRSRAGPAGLASLPRRMVGRDVTVGPGQRFGVFVVVSQCHGHRGKGTYWHVTCDCGATRIVRGKNLTQGNTASCGDESKHPRSSGFESVGQTGMTFAEIALVLGISRSMARADFERALRKLRNNQAVLAAMREHR